MSGGEDGNNGDMGISPHVPEKELIQDKVEGIKDENKDRYEEAIIDDKEDNKEKISRKVSECEDLQIKISEEIVKDETNNWRTYKDENFGVEIKYPTSACVSTIPPSNYMGFYGWSSVDWKVEGDDGGKIIGSLLVCNFKNDPNFDFYYTFTAEFRVGANSDPREVENCFNVFSDNEKTETVNVNGIKFRKFVMQDASTGNRAHIEIYRTIHNNICFSLEKLNYGAYYTELVYPESRHYNYEVFKRYKSCNEALDKMLSTFKFSK